MWAPLYGCRHQFPWGEESGVRIPDWFVYTVVLTGVLYALLTHSDGAEDVPEPVPEDIIFPDVTLPAPSIFDEKVLVEVDDSPSPGIGTAFALARNGMWMTARHVVEDCRDLALQIGNSTIVPVVKYETDHDADLALLYTDGGPEPVVLGLDRELKVGQFGFHIGYPQGRPGEVTSRLLARSTLSTYGRYSNSEPVLAWAESGRTRNLNGSLGGISGGPVFNTAGQALGVTIAESPRRGRIYTTAPQTTQSFIDMEADVPTDGDQTRGLTARNYGAEGDSLRRNLTVVKVICRARN